MWPLYSRVLRRAAWLPLRALRQLDTYAGMLLLAFAAIGVGTWQQLLPWWLPYAAFGLLVLWGLLKANYEEYKESYDERGRLGDEKEELEKKLAYGTKRKAVHDLLGDALEEGMSLKQGRTYDLEGENPDKEEDELLDEHLARYEAEIHAWVDRTYDLIHNAFGKAEAQRFISNEGFSEEELFGRKLPRFMYRTSTQRKYSIPARLKRLDKLIDRANVLEISPGFDPQSAAEGTGESAAARLRLMTAIEQSRAENERLKTDYERATAERNAFELDSRKYKGELDGQIRGRCFEVSRDLFAFHEEVKDEDPDDAMRRYGERLRDRVDPLRSDLMRYEKWNPKEEAREHLEYPTHPDHLLGLADYLNASCGHGFW